MSTFELDITGELPLEIEGELIFEENTKWRNGNENNRYYGIAIYKTEKQWFAQVEYLTIWRGEEEIRQVFEADSIEQLAIQIESYDPLAYLVGYPAGECYRVKQEKLKAQLLFDYSVIKIDALKALGIKREQHQQIKNLGFFCCYLPKDLLDFAKAEKIDIQQELKQLLEGKRNG